MPGCIEGVRWRVLEDPMKISIRQRDLIDKMITFMRDPKTCMFATAGRPRNDGTNFVDVSRPVQNRNSKHNLMHCESRDFGKYRTPSFAA